MSHFGRCRVCRSVLVSRVALKLATIGLLAGLFGVATRTAWADQPPAEKKIPAPANIELETADGLQMQATYYGSIAGKDAVPIIMLHGFKGSRADFAGLALDMQAKGCAVIVPDLRGHGKSTQIKHGTDLATIEAANLRKADFEAMVTQDLEAIKTYLMDRNNAGELNIEKLCVVGNGMGAMVAVNWAVYDWHWPQLPSVKQGQDVKALVLISPPLNFKGISIIPALGTNLLRTDLSVLILAGDKNRTAMSDAKRIHTLLSAARPKPPTDARDIEDRQDLFLSTVGGATLQGPDILNDKGILPKLDFVIRRQFIEWRLVNKKFPWTNRKPALGQ